MSGACLGPGDGSHRQLLRGGGRGSWNDTLVSFSDLLWVVATPTKGKISSYPVPWGQIF